MKVGIVTVLHNTGISTDSFAAALEETVPADVPVVAVDNGSDGAGKRLTKISERTTVLVSENRGFGAACNEGVHQMKGVDAFVFLNPDTRPQAGWLERIVVHLEEQPRVGIAFARTPREARTETRLHGHDLVASSSGAAMAVRSNVFESLSGFDESLFLYWEETDFAWRAWLEGWLVTTVYGSIVEHAKGGSGGGSRWAAMQTKNGQYVIWSLLPVPTALCRSIILSGLAVVRGIRHQDLELIRAIASPPGGWWRVFRRRRAFRLKRRRNGAGLARLVRAHAYSQLRARFE